MRYWIATRSRIRVSCDPAKASGYPVRNPWPSSHYMQALLDRFESGNAVLKIMGQELIVPKKDLPKNAHEGSALFLLFSQDASEEAHREKLAKSILNEILKTER